MVRRRLVQLLTFVLAAAGAVGLGMAAPAHAQESPDKVTIGIYINDIQEIDLASNSFTGDFYLWLRWRDPEMDPSVTIEAMNSTARDNSTSSSSGGVVGKPLYAEPLDMPDGSKYMVLRFQGVFSKEYNLERYPFDVQNLLFVFEDERLTSDQLEFVPDATPVTINGDVSLPGYLVGKPRMEVVSNKYPTNFGDISGPPTVTYSQVVVTVPMTRDVLPYLVKLMLPIFIVVLITSLIYVIPARLEEARAGIGVTAMLTVVALQWSTDSSLPSVEYLTMLDLIYLIAMFYILIAMSYTVIASRRNKYDAAEALITQFDRRVGITALILYIILTAGTMLFYLQRFH